MDEPTTRSQTLSELLSGLSIEEIEKLPVQKQREILRLIEKLSSKPDEGEAAASWIKRNFPHTVSKAFAPRHLHFLDWFTSLKLNEVGEDYVHCAPRGGGKSAILELGIVYVAVKGSRRLCLYVCKTQEQANKHVASIRTHLEKLKMQAQVTTYGNSKAWRADMLICANGFSIVAVGLDTAVRGLRIDDIRPDLIALDDIDSREDTLGAVQEKILTITDTILPSGSDSCVVCFAQNKIGAHTVMSRILSDTPPFITGRIIGCDEPAINGLSFEEYRRQDGSYAYRITGGEPTWSGQDLKKCERTIEKDSLRSFLREAQHVVKGEEIDALWRLETIERSRIKLSQCPDWGSFMKIVIALDIAVSTSAGSDSTAIVAGGVTRDWQFYVWLAVAGRWKPEEWARKAVKAYDQYRALRIAAEKNQGGLLIETAIHTVKRVPVSLIHVHQSKEVRADAASVLYEMGRVHHVGALPDLEDEQVSWVPGTGKPSPNLIDALVILLMELDPRIRSGKTVVYNQFRPQVEAGGGKGIIDLYEEDDYDRSWPKSG